MLRRFAPVGIGAAAFAFACMGLNLLVSAGQQVASTVLDPTRAQALAIAATQTAESTRATLTATAQAQAAQAAQSAQVSPWLWPLLLGFVGVVALLLVLADRHEQRLDLMAAEAAAESDRRMAPFYIAEAGGTPIPLDHLLADPGFVLTLEGERTRRLVGIAQAEPQYPLLTTLNQHHAPSYSVLPNRDVPTQPLTALAGPEPAAALAPGLPDACTLLDVMRAGFTPSVDAILLGLGPGGERITVSADDTMCHLLMAGQTGRGKSALFRLLMVQLLLAGGHVYWLDPNFAPFDTRRKIDLRPLGGAVGPGLITDVSQIARFFQELAGPELARRQTTKRATGDAGAPLYVFADEWPQLITLHKEIAAPAATCLRNYRQYDGYFAVGSQDGLVETMGLNSGELGQFATRYYVGGADDTTRKRLTGSVRNPDPPGRGIVYLKAAPLPQPAEVRVPYVGNADQYELLGAPATPPPWGWEGITRRWPGVSTAAPVAARVAVATPPPTATNGSETAVTATTAVPAWPFDTAKVDPAKAVEALRLFHQGSDLAVAVSTAFGVNKDSPSAFNGPRNAVLALLRQRSQQVGD